MIKEVVMRRVEAIEYRDDSEPTTPFSVQFKIETMHIYETVLP